MAEMVIARPRPLTSQQRKRRQVEGLFKRQNGLCYWCNGAMVLFDERIMRRNRPLPDNLATVDHLDDKFSPERGKHGGEIRRVLACMRCNGLRGSMAQRSQPIEELRERAQRHRGNRQIQSVKP